MPPLIKKGIIVLVILILLFVAYKFFVQKDEAPALSTETSENLPAEAGGDLLSLLLELRSLTLGGKVLSDPAFATLEDFTVSIPPEPIGRRNPFAPIGAVTTPVGTTTTPDF
ncbi:MAG: hypothetical protein AAB460_02730 [Patescibacteria group bacterium]